MKKNVRALLILSDEFGLWGNKTKSLSFQVPSSFSVCTICQNVLIPDEKQGVFNV
jgi:hypothetical protein